MAVTEEQIARINALARKAKTPEGLNEEEKKEQAELRRAYIEAFRESTKRAVESLYIQQEDGSYRQVQQKQKES